MQLFVFIHAILREEEGTLLGESKSACNGEGEFTSKPLKTSKISFSLKQKFF